MHAPRLGVDRVNLYTEVNAAKIALAYAAAQSFGFAFALFVTAILAWRMVDERPSLRDFAMIMLGLGLMLALLLPLRGKFDPWLELTLLPILGAGIFSSVMFAGNVTGLREKFSMWRGSRAKGSGNDKRDDKSL